jgi:hypothetical protein
MNEIARISREKMDKRKNARHRKAKTKVSKTNIRITWSITERKPDIRRSGDKENAAQRKIHMTDR